MHAKYQCYQPVSKAQEEGSPSGHAHIEVASVHQLESCITCMTCCAVNAGGTLLSHA